MYKKLLAFISAALITACSNHPDSNSNTNNTNQRVLPSELIVPGKSIGTIYINQNIDSIIAKLGKPNFADNAMGASLNIWYGNQDSLNHITAVFSRRDFSDASTPQSLVKIIHVTSDKYKTSEGVGVGISLNKVKNRFKLKQLGYYYAPDKDTLKIFDDVAHGIAFEVNNKNKLAGVLIHNTGDSLIANTSIRMHMNYKRL